MKQRWAGWLTALLVLGALVLVVRVFRQLSLADAIESVHRLTVHDIALTALCAAGSYLCLTGFDYLGVRYAGHRLPYRQVALTSFVSLSIGHTIGLSPLSSGAVRYRFYTQRGLDAVAVAKVIAFSALTVALGELSLAAVALIGNPSTAARILDIAPATARLLGAGCLGAVAVYVLATIVLRRAVRIGGVAVGLPSWRLALGQIVVGAANYALVAAALTCSIAPAGHIGYASVATAYIIANLAALVSHVPGGLGVIEAVVVTLFPGVGVIGGLVAFRVIYFFIPFALGTLIFSAIELQSWMRRRGRLATRPATDSAG